MTTFTPAKLDLVAGGSAKRMAAKAEFICVRAVTGSIELRLNGGEFFPIVAGDYFRAVKGETFMLVDFRSVAGGSVTLLHGFGEVLSLSTSTGGSTVKEIYTGAFADPNGNVIPDDPTKAAIYYDDTAAPTLWTWSVAGGNWI